MNNQSTQGRSSPTCQTSSKSCGGSFRLNAKTLFLTYPQCPIAPEEALEELKQKLPIQDWIICQEKHKDGHDHLHCYLRLERKVNLKDPTKLDLGVYHGNYQTCRSPAAVKNYVKKGGAYISSPNMGNLNEENVWQTARALAKDGQITESLSTLEKNKQSARDLCLHGEQIERNLRKLCRQKMEIKHQLNTFNWNIQWDRSLTLILSGETNTGKTSISKALLPNGFFVTHMDQLREYNEDYGGIIFDDMAFRHMPDTAQIHLVDTYEERHIHCRYAAARIPAGTPRIITTNMDPGNVINLGNEAIARRCLCVIVAGVGKYKIQ